MKSILISIPTPPNGKIVNNLVKFLMNVIHHPKYKVHVDIVEGKPIDSVRNNAINRFLEIGYDYILTIDSDIVPPLNVIDELMSHDKKFIGATCFSFQYDTPFAVILDRLDNGEGGYVQSKNIGKQRLIKCHATGAACVLIHRDVILDMKKNLQEKQSQTMYYKTLYREDGTLSWGQDFMFCENAKKAGHDLYVDTGVLCDHFVDGFNLKKANDFWINVNNQNKKS